MTTGRWRERERELAVLSGVLDAAGAGRGGAVLLEGPAGIGKSTLISATAEMARARTMQTLLARASPMERDVSFGVVRQLLELAVHRVDGPARARLMRGAATLAAPVLDSITAREENSLEVPAALHGLYWLCVNLSDAAPLALLVDDGHWADAPSLRWLGYLACRAVDVPIVVVCAARPRVGAVPTAVADELALDPDLIVLRPQALSAPAVAALVADLAGAEPDRLFVQACVEVTGGNPLLVRETVREVAQSGAAPTAQAVSLVRSLGPAPVAAAVQRRLRLLPAAAAQIARAVAVLGSHAEPALAGTLAGLEEESRATAVDALVGENILEQARPLRFTHPVVRSALYECTTSAERQRLHRRAAVLLANAGADPESVAAHLLQTDANTDAWVTERLRDAASAAAARGAPDGATRYLSRALRQAPSVQVRTLLLHQLGRAERSLWASMNTPSPAALTHLGEALQAAEDPRAVAEIAHDLAHAHLVIRGFANAVAVLDRARARVQDRELRLADRLEAEAVSIGLVDLGTCARARARLAELVDRSPSDGIAGAMLTSARALVAANADEAAGLAEQALAGGALLDGDNALGLGLVTHALIWSDQLERAIEILDAAAARARAAGSATTLSAVLVWRCHAAYRRGDLADAEADLTLSIDLWPEALQRGAWGTLGYGLEVLLERDGPVAADELWTRLAAGQLPPPVLLSAQVHYARGRLRLAHGRAKDALADFLEAGQRLDRLAVRIPGAIPWRAGAVLAHVALGNRAAALRLATEETAGSRTRGTHRGLGIALHAEGLAHANNTGLERLREAAAVLQRSPARLEHARALVDLGAALRRHGQRVEARTILRDGLHAAHALGAACLAERAREELAHAGARPRRAAVAGVNALTASERRIAQLASQGMANREIAQTLFLSEKTVEGHLSNAYRKLDIRSRALLPEALAS